MFSMLVCGIRVSVGDWSELLVEKRSGVCGVSLGICMT